MKNFNYFLTLTMAAIFISCIAVFFSSREFLGIFSYLATSDILVFFLLYGVGGLIVKKYWGERGVRIFWLINFVVCIFAAIKEASIFYALAALASLWFARPRKSITATIS